MARCPSCRSTFRVMEDEDDGQHDCPSCGYPGPRCPWCGEGQDDCDCDPEDGIDLAEDGDI
jgi:hypothetical protein